MLTFDTCRVCGNSKLDYSGNLGRLPQINRNSNNKKESLKLKKLPLSLFFCEHCYHLQLNTSFEPEETFRSYTYATQFTKSIKRHGRLIVSWFRKKYRMQKKDFIIEIASSDGAILRSFVELGYKRVLGIEPALNIARIARRHGIKTESHFFSRKYASKIVDKYGRADFVLARNVLAHVPETIDFLQGVRDLLKPEGVFCVEMPYAKNLIDYLEFDSIYHEHLSYYLIGTLKYLLGRAGLEIIDIEETNIHTGSIAVFAKRVERKRKVFAKVEALIKEERDNQYYKKETYTKFVRDCKKQIGKIENYVKKLNKRNSLVAGYGGSAKANVILNLANIDYDSIDFIADRSPIKQDTWSPGSGIRITDTNELAKQPVTDIIVFAWNFADEILMENKQLLKMGRKFHILIPRPSQITPSSIKSKSEFRFLRSLD